MLKRIEIYGFKSFAEKTVLTFDGALNGIVGPNGSGKSNIVDAIKWCLGEQALSHIRCKNTIDVIFAGSESKPMLNYCEVTVVFDNSNGVFPIDFQEVEITRKLYRTGETEYYINRAPCRLKDIKDLVLDTGLSSSGYAIIPQGKVEFVVTAKPEERRLLFEETAGVAKFKYHREESLRKLERVKLDMARIEDILSYLKDQMASLESSVRKAKNFQKYKEELQVLECANIVKQIDEIDTKLSQMNHEFNNLNQTYGSQIAELADMESKNVDLKTSIIELEKKVIELKDKLSQVEIEISLTTQKIETLKNQNIDSLNNISKLNSEIESLKQTISSYEDELKNLYSKQESIKQQIEIVGKQKQEHQQEYDTYRSLINEKQNLLKEQNTKVTDLAYRKTKLQNDLSSNNQKLNSLNFEMNSLEKDLEINSKEKTKLEEEILSLNSQIDKLNQEKNNLSTNLAQVDTELKNLDDVIAQKKAVIENLNKEFYILNSKLENINSAMFSQPYSLQKVVKYIEELNNTKIFGPIKSILKFNPQKYSLIASFLGNKLYWFIAETQQDAVDVIEKLKTQNVGFITFLVKEKIEKLEFRNLEENTISSLVEYDSQWEKIIKFLFSDIQLQQNNVLTSEIIVHGGNFVPKEGEEDLYQLETQISSYNELIQKENKELLEVNNKYYTLISQKNFYEKQLLEIETKIETLKKLKLEKETYLKTLDDLLATLSQQFQRYNKEKEELGKIIETLNLELNTLEEEEKSLKSSVIKLSEEISQLQSSSVMDNFLKIVSEYSKLEEQNNNIANEINIKQSLITENFSRINAVKTEIEEQQSLIEKNKTEIVSQEEKLSQLLNERSLVSQQVTNLQNSLEQKRTDLENLESAIKCLLNTKEELQQKLKSLELQINTETNNKTNYINWLKDKYNLSLEEAKSMYSNIEVDVSQIDKLKKRIETMGAINLAAPEEYVQLEEKYNTLITQQQDLIKSEQDIKQAISKINEQISTNFKDTFAKVRENFKKLVEILFEGGKADLVLTNEENVLETGIDIIVQPPGKKLQNINLLSGGEKSLVALALLFAFFMVKPSPVCILDEADAPLDEANVVRFMKLLKEFSKSTKFLLITHITRTMENLDNIYGVTMEELGVSKIISLKLQKEQAEVSS
jgi:chromosome segregation protein